MMFCVYVHYSCKNVSFLYHDIIGCLCVIKPTISVIVSPSVLIKSSMFQNSVLGVVLASQHFGNPLTAVPCAVSSVCHSILGSALAGIWRQSVPTQKQD